MSRIRGKNTAPEMVVRGLVHGMGFGYRLHRLDLPVLPTWYLPVAKGNLCPWVVLASA